MFGQSMIWTWNTFQFRKESDVDIAAIFAGIARKGHQLVANNRLARKQPMSLA